MASAADTELRLRSLVSEAGALNTRVYTTSEGLGSLADALLARVAALESKAQQSKDVLGLNQLADSLAERVQSLEARRLPDVAENLSRRVDLLESLDSTPSQAKAELDMLTSSLESRISKLEINSTDSREFDKVNAELQVAVEKLAVSDQCKNELEQMNAQLLARVQSLESENQRQAPAFGARIPVENGSDMQEVVLSLRKRLEELESQRMLAVTMREELKGSPMGGDCQALQERLVAVELERRTLQTEIAQLKGGEKIQTIDTKEIERLEREKYEAFAQMRQSQAQLQSQVTLTMASEQREQQLLKEIRDLQAENANVSLLDQRSQQLQRTNATLVERINTLETNQVESRGTRGRSQSWLEMESQNKDLHQRIAILESGVGIENGHDIPANAQEMINLLLARVETLETRQVLAQTMQEEARVSRRELGETDDVYENLSRQLAASEFEKRKVQTDFAQYKQMRESKEVDDERVSQLEQEKYAALAQAQDALAQAQAAHTLQATLQSQLQVFQNRAKQAEDSLNAVRIASGASDKDILLQENVALQEELQQAAQERSALITRVSQREIEFQQIANAKNVAEIKVEALIKETQSAIKAVSTSKPAVSLSLPKVGAPSSPAFASYISTGTREVLTQQSGDLTPRTARSRRLSSSASIPSASPPVTYSPTVRQPSARTMQAPVTYNPLVAQSVSVPQGIMHSGRYPPAKVAGYQAQGSARALLR